MSNFIKAAAYTVILSAGQVGMLNAATIDITIAVDSSGSMLTDDRRARTIEFTKWLISSFDAYESTSDDEYRFGVIQFGGAPDPVANIEYNFTDDQALSSVISVVDSMEHITGWTPTGQAVQQAINLFDSQSGESFNQHLFIITDGQPYMNSTDPCALMPTGFGTTVITIDLPVFETALECLVDNPVTDIVEAAGFSQLSVDAINEQLTAVPVPAAVWLFVSGLMGLVGFAKRKKV